MKDLRAGYLVGLVTAASMVAVGAAPAAAQQPSAARLMESVGIDQRLGAELPADLPLVDAAGRPVRLGDLLGGRPVVFSLVYYECPMLCGVTLDGLVGALKTLSLEVGRDFDVVTVSIDPGETPAMAAASKEAALREYGRRGSGDGWHALVGDADAIATLAGTVGFRYLYDPERDEYAHAAAIMVVTPEGRLARYFYGVAYPPRDLRLSLVEAGDGAIGGLADQVLLLCYRYDPVTGRYGFAVWTAIRVLGGATVLVLAVAIAWMLRGERRQGAGPSGSGSNAGSGAREPGPTPGGGR